MHVAEKVKYNDASGTDSLVLNEILELLNIVIPSSCFQNTSQPKHDTTSPCNHKLLDLGLLHRALLAFRSLLFS